MAQAEPQTHDEAPRMRGCDVTNLSGSGDTTPTLRVEATVESPSIHTYKFDLLITVGGIDTFWFRRTHTQFGLSTETYTHEFTVTTPLQTGQDYDVNASVRNPEVVDTD